MITSKAVFAIPQQIRQELVHKVEVRWIVCSFALCLISLQLHFNLNPGVPHFTVPQPRSDLIKAEAASLTLTCRLGIPIPITRPLRNSQSQSIDRYLCTVQYTSRMLPGDTVVDRPLSSLSFSYTLNTL